jgi:hypothetical protein
VRTTSTDSAATSGIAILSMFVATLPTAHYKTAQHFPGK